MQFNDFKKVFMNCNDDTNVIVFVKDELGYRPFENIKVKYYGKTCSGYLNELHIDVSIEKEYKNIHFPNNPEKEDIESLLEERKAIVERLVELNEELGAFKPQDKF